MHNSDSDSDDLSDDVFNGKFELFKEKNLKILKNFTPYDTKSNPIEGIPKRFGLI